MPPECGTKATYCQSVHFAGWQVRPEGEKVKYGVVQSNATYAQQACRFYT